MDNQDKNTEKKEQDPKNEAKPGHTVGNSGNRRVPNRRSRPPRRGVPLGARSDTRLDSNERKGRNLQRRNDSPSRENRGNVAAKGTRAEQDVDGNRRSDGSYRRPDGRRTDGRKSRGASRQSDSRGPRDRDDRQERSQSRRRQASGDHRGERQQRLGIRGEGRERRPSEGRRRDSILPGERLSGRSSERLRGGRRDERGRPIERNRSRSQFDRPRNKPEDVGGERQERNERNERLRGRQDSRVRGRQDVRNRGRQNERGRGRPDDRNRGRQDDRSSRTGYRDSVEFSVSPKPAPKQEVMFEGRKGDFLTMQSSQIEFLKPHDVEDEIQIEDIPEYDFKENSKLIDSVSVKLNSFGIIDDFSCDDMILKPQDEVIVETERGLALGVVVVATTRRIVEDQEIPRVIRKASSNDVRQRERNATKEDMSFKLCQEQIEKLNLDMKLVRVNYLHGGNKAIFYFSADGRIDFRTLVRELAKRLHIRVEMRQIGVRDAARMLGGIGSCGIQLCCNRYIREFQPVSIKMAKDQDLVLNPEKVSGLCGRLMCCLAYEEEAYKEAVSELPKIGKIVMTPKGEGRVKDRDVLRRIVRVEVASENGIFEFPLADLRRIERPTHCDKGEHQCNKHCGHQGGPSKNAPWSSAQSDSEQVIEAKEIRPVKEVSQQSKEGEQTNAMEQSVEGDEKKNRSRDDSAGSKGTDAVKDDKTSDDKNDQTSTADVPKDD